MSTDNVVNVTDDRIADEWASHETEAAKFVVIEETDTEEKKPAPEISEDGVTFPDIEAGALCAMAGDWWAKHHAPNWQANGFDEDKVRSVSRPAGAVVDKYLLKYFPDFKIATFIDEYSAEAALIFAVVAIKEEFREIPRYTEEQQKEREKGNKKGWFSGWFKGDKNGEA